MVKTEFICKCLEDLSAVAEEVIKHLDTTPIILLKGDLGTGKTTFTKYFLSRFLNSQEGSSPTYGLINVYVGKLGSKELSIIHADLYRLEHRDEVYDIGLFDQMDQPNTITFIEWPEFIERDCDEAILLEFYHLPKGDRKIVLSLV